MPTTIYGSARDVAAMAPKRVKAASKGKLDDEAIMEGVSEIADYITAGAKDLAA